MSEKRSERERKYRERLEKIEQHKNDQKVSKPAHQPKLKIGNRIPKLKKKRRWASEIRAGSLLLFFGIILIFTGYLISPFSKVSKITISGNSEVSNSEVIKSAELRSKPLMISLLSNSKKYVKIAHENNPQIKNLQFRATGFRSIKVSVTENKIAGFYEKNNYYYPMLENGHMDKTRYDQPIGGRPVYLGFKSVKIAKATATQYGKLSDSIKNGISEIRYSPTKTDGDRLKIYMTDGNQVLVKYNELAKKMKYYPEIAATMVSNGVVNLEIGAYSYPYGNTAK